MNADTVSSQSLLERISLPVLLSLIIVYLVWGSTYLVIRFTIESIPAYMLTSMRCGIAGFILLGMGRIRGNKSPSVEQIRNAAIIGALMFGGAGTVAFSEHYVDSGLVALGVAVVPIWASIFAGFFGTWPGRLEWIGLLVGLTGIAILNMENGMRSNPIGATALLFGPMLWAFGSMWSRRLSLPDGFTGTGYQLLGGSFILIFVSYFGGERLTAFPTPTALAGFVYLTIMSSVVAFAAYMYLVRTVRPALSTSYAYVNPVIAVMLGVIIAHEKITMTGYIAMVVIVTGVILLAFGKERKIKIPV